MFKKLKKKLIIATSFIIIGTIIFTGAMAMLKWDFTKLSTTKFETNIYDITEEFKNISVITKTADIIFIPSDNKQSRITCFEYENSKHSVSVKDDTLTIDINSNEKWYNHIGINLKRPKITMEISQKEFVSLLIKSTTGDIEIPKDFKFQTMEISGTTNDVKNYASANKSIKIKTTTGDIITEDISANSIDISATTGDISAKNITCLNNITIQISSGDLNITNSKCKNLSTKGTTGNTTLKNVIATEKISAKRTTGDVTFDKCDAKDLFIKVGTGKITGTLLSDKIFIAKTTTGKINVPQTTTGGKCEISTTTGSINISIVKD